MLNIPRQQRYLFPDFRHTDIGTSEDQPVILHFRLRRAELFGFEWA